MYFYRIKQILLISDTHGHLGDEVLEHALVSDEVWHAGDWGNNPEFTKLEEMAVVRGVYGNIDDIIIRNRYPKEHCFSIEDVTVFMTHIGGYPGRYEKTIKEKLDKIKPQLYICGHSHICKVMKDNRLDLYHFNPGAIGNKGFHKKRTMLKFKVERGRIFDVNVLEYEKK